MEINTMTDIAVSKSFNEKMEEKIKESIGEMMSSEDLQKIIATGIEKAFFKQTEIKSGYNTVYKDSFLVEHIRANMDKLVAREIAKRFNEDKEQFSKLIEKTLEKDIFELFQRGFNENFKDALINFRSALANKLQSQDIDIY